MHIRGITARTGMYEAAFVLLPKCELRWEVRAGASGVAQRRTLLSPPGFRCYLTSREPTVVGCAGESQPCSCEEGGGWSQWSFARAGVNCHS